MIDRRTFIRLSLVATGGCLLPLGCDRPLMRGANSDAAPVGDTVTPDTLSPSEIPAKVTKFVDPLPRPAALTPIGTENGLPLYEIEQTAFMQRLHSEFPETPVWGYAGGYPGPTLDTRRGQAIRVRWVNKLPADDKHLLEEVYDMNLHGANHHEPHVRTVVHLHGGHVPPASDGHPEGWITPGQSATYEYPNSQPAATLWYHDHALGITRLNVYAGLAGFYLIRDDAEDALGLPSGEYEIALAIQDRSFHKTGELRYEARDPNEVPTNAAHPGPWVPELFGTMMLVNGKVWPYLEVEPRKYRFRLLNGCNSRFLELALEQSLSFSQIGSDGGLLAAPTNRQNLLMAPGERTDVVVDFSALAPGTSLRLLNRAPDGPFSGPVPDAQPADPETTGQVMQFRVIASKGSDTSRVPTTLATIERLDPTSAVTTRDMTLEEVLDENDEPIEARLNGKEWTAPIETKPALGDVEVWNLINLTGDTHPIHLHLVQFHVLDRQPFDSDEYLAALTAFRTSGGEAPKLSDFLTGSPVLPEAHEYGLKDTVQAHPGEVTRIIARFDGHRGRYPWHCHILEHEDNEMMLQFEVV